MNKYKIPQLNIKLIFLTKIVALFKLEKYLRINN